MKVVMTLKSGLLIELPISNIEDFNILSEEIYSFKKFLRWRNRIWVNKKEIASFEIVTECQNEEQTI